MTSSHRIYDRIPYSPLPNRPIVTWPNGARLAVWIAPNIEHYEYMPPRHPQKEPWPRVPHPDIQQYSFRDYGNRVGVWRMAEAIEEFDVPCTVSLNLGVLEHFPEIRDLIVERDWAVMSHGIYNTRYLFGMSEHEERAFYQDNIATLLANTGLHLKGMLGPALTGTISTPDLMAEAGLLYHADWVLDDQPTPLLVEGDRKLITMPYSYELDDAPLFAKHFDGAYFAEACKRQFDRLYRDAEHTGLVMCIALHPFQIGQPHLIGYLREILEYMRGFDEVWFATADEIAEHYLTHHYDGALAYSNSHAAGGDPDAS